ncbi:MAG: deoxyribodipyrimidine photo-lyase [Syntrophorhabdaceae bacterium]
MNALDRRTRPIRAGQPEGGTVAYWMSRDQRVHDNWALVFAQKIASGHGLPLVVVFCLSRSFLGAGLRQYGFMLRGLKKTADELTALSIPFILLIGAAPDVLPRFVDQNKISFLVTDFDPLRIKMQWRDAVSRQTSIPFYEVDAHNIVPCWIASDKREYGAYTLRKKVRRLLPEFLGDLPEIERHRYPAHYTSGAIDADALLTHLQIDRSINEVPGVKPGEDEARAVLESFLNRIEDYEISRNDPTRKSQSHLSPYLHFGHISAQRIATQVRKFPARGSAKDAFLEELIVRRELSDNYCYHTPDYDSFDALPEWARKTLNQHRGDPRPFLYSPDKFEFARTHDDLWNAAQMQMVRTGSMHGYMRMYWAKKILEWSASPEEALSLAISLNDRYELDGRDPNGYTGIAWSIGGLHDRAWRERNVFGKIRYMSYNGCASKFNIKRYIETNPAL